MEITVGRSSDHIELLSPALLDDERETIEQIARVAASHRIQLGWHYLLDVAWTVKRLPMTPGSTVLDAGAGIGVTQWLLASRGLDVVSVDRLDRSRLSLRFRIPYRVRGLRPDDLRSPLASGLADLRSGAIAVDAGRDLKAVVNRLRGVRTRGSVTVHHASLEDLSALPSESIDGIVSISSLEHNDPGRLPSIVDELWRVLRPGGVLTATLGAARDEDWFHAPSKGWCFTEQTLRTAFAIDPSVPSNFSEFDAIFEATRSSDELRRRLARSYFRSGENGMPWGRWDPTYLSVGVCRVKPH